MLRPTAEKKIQGWIRSRHVICSGNFFVFETVDYAAIERFIVCITALGGTVISVDPISKLWMGAHRQVLYRTKASLHTPHHDLKQYWMKYGNFRTRFDQSLCDMEMEGRREGEKGDSGSRWLNSQSLAIK